jgi:hypothetical protein
MANGSNNQWTDAAAIDQGCTRQQHIGAWCKLDQPLVTTGAGALPLPYAPHPASETIARTTITAVTILFIKTPLSFCWACDLQPISMQQVIPASANTQQKSLISCWRGSRTDRVDVPTAVDCEFQAANQLDRNQITHSTGRKFLTASNRNNLPNKAGDLKRTRPFQLGYAAEDRERTSVPNIRTCRADAPLQSRQVMGVRGVKWYWRIS